MRRLILLTALAMAAIACEAREAPRGDSSSGAQPVRVERKEEPTAHAECGTLRDVVEPDLVTVVGEVLLHLDETEGFGLTSVGDPAHPRDIARVPFVGTPIALHVRPPLAWIAYIDWDEPGAATIIRVIDIARPDAPRITGTMSRPGVATGTALVDGVFYVFGAKARSDASSAIASYRVSDGHLSAGDELVFEGRPAALAASPAGLATIATTPAGVSVSWIDLSRERPGAMTLRGTRAVGGGFPAWERDVVSADEGQGVRFLACATKECRVEEDALVRVVDFARGAGDVRASLPVRIGAGVPVARFAGDRLYVGDGATLRVVDLDPVPRVIGSLPLAGTLSAIHPLGARVLTVGTVGTPAARIRVAVNDVDVSVPSFPRLRGMATFGDDWTWSRAADDDRAISTDPTRDLVALPFSTWRARDGRYATGAQLIAHGQGAPALREAVPADGHVERVMFVKGHLLAVGGGTVTVLETAAERERELEVR